MMLPEAVTLIPTYIVFRTVHWIDTLFPLIVRRELGAIFDHRARTFAELLEAAR